MTPFDFETFLEIAESLAAEPTEAAWRSGVSSAYYALLHVAHAALPATVRGSISHGAIHRDVWRLYGASSSMPCRQIGQNGVRLRLARIQADYRAAVLMTQPDTQRYVEDARRAVDLLRRYGYQP